MKSDSSSSKQHYTLALAAAGLLMANALAASEKNVERKKKMLGVIEKKWNLFQEAFPNTCNSIAEIPRLENVIRHSIARHEAVTLLIDLAFINPFTPYELTVKNSDLAATVKTLAAFVGVNVDKVDKIYVTQKDALKAHRRIGYAKLAVLTVAALVAVGVGAWFAAPFIGTAIGTAAGLSGAAATAHGLAILGGGSLAIGGFGMAGGAWLIVGGSMLTVGLTGGAALLAMGAAAAKLELVKLQVTFKEVLLADQKRAQAAITSLAEHEQEIKHRLEEELALNEKNSLRVKNVEETLRAITDSITWMNDEQLRHNTK